MFVGTITRKMFGVPSKEKYYNMSETMETQPVLRQQVTLCQLHYVVKFNVCRIYVCKKVSFAKHTIKFPANISGQAIAIYSIPRAIDIFIALTSYLLSIYLSIYIYTVKKNIMYVYIIIYIIIYIYILNTFFFYYKLCVLCTMCTASTCCF